MEIFFCPDCGEDVPVRAAKCPFCSRSFLRIWKIVAGMVLFLSILVAAVAAILYDISA